jgi:hypothetical protein
MATMTVASVKEELDDYVANNRSVITTGLYNAEIQLDKYCKTVSKVKGKYPQFHKLLTRVVQGFKPEWQALGEMQFKAKVLQNYRQKVNLPIIVDEIYGTWLSDLKIEGKTPEEQPISKVIIEELLLKVIDDLADLSVTAVFDAANADGQFGKSLNGINQIITLGKANTTNPVYHVPLDAIVAANVIEQFRAFERAIPNKARKGKIAQVFCSENVALMYHDAIVDAYGDHTNYNEMRTKTTETYKLEIVGLEGLSDTIIFATPQDNMLRLVDVIDNPPTITDTQVQDYELKIFMEFHLGYDFAINEMVFVANFDGSTPAGLQSNTLNELYYSFEDLPTV